MIAYRVLLLVVFVGWITMWCLIADGSWLASLMGAVAGVALAELWSGKS